MVFQTHVLVLFTCKYFAQSLISYNALCLIILQFSWYSVNSHEWPRQNFSLQHQYNINAGREIAPNTGANATKFFTLVTKSWKLVAKLATRTFHYNLTKRYREFKKFAKINLRQTSSLSLFPKRSTCISIDN